MNEKRIEEKIKIDLKQLLTDFRYNHSIMVAQEAKKLALHYNIDKNQAYLAGLVHDIAKDFNTQKKQYWIKKYKIEKDWLTKESESILHAEIGYYVVQAWYHLEKNICTAVRFHTIGNINMDLLAKIIFIADKIARPKRTKELAEVAKLAYQNIDQALLLYLINQKKLLESQHKNMHKDTLLLLNYLQQA